MGGRPSPHRAGKVALTPGSSASPTSFVCFCCPGISNALSGMGGHRRALMASSSCGFFGDLRLRLRTSLPLPQERRGSVSVKAMAVAEGLPPRYRDSVRAITPGLPLFLYSYTTHQLHGIFEAASFGGSNIDPTAWEDKKCKGESRFPAQVRIRVRKLCKPLEEDDFRPVLHHYDGPKFCLELSIAETLSLLDLCEKEGI